MRSCPCTRDRGHMTTTRPDHLRDGIAAAAVRCFERYGPQRTSMADIADEAGISRQSIYRAFEDRPALINFILNRRITLMADGVREHFAKYTTFEEAVVEGSLESLRAGREDRLFRDIVTKALDHTVEQFLLNGTDEIHRAMMSYWAPVLQKARKSGIVKSKASNDQIVEWIRHVHTVLGMRDDLDDDGLREILTNFVVPSITGSGV